MMPGQCDAARPLDVPVVLRWNGTVHDITLPFEAGRGVLLRVSRSGKSRLTAFGARSPAATVTKPTW